MKVWKWYGALLLLMVAQVLFAAETPTVVVGDPAIGEPGPVVAKEVNIWQAMIAVIVPAIIAGIKALLPKIPPKIIPWLAPVLGAVIDILLNVFNLGEGNGAIGAALGTLGIGIRELFHNTTKK